MRMLLPVVALCALGAPLKAAEPPTVAREFRGVWVATVANIDWPSKKGLSTSEQQAELKAILDKAVALRLNAIVFQVRPMCDALYASKLEPWSEFLTGKAGQAPDPPWDPLEFAVREAHGRGLELHAWINPYRAWQPSATSPPPADHLVKARPDLAKPYGKHHWLNPTHPDVQAHVLKVVLDITTRYDIDGLHLDDYFYPYKEQDSAKKPIPFPDDDTWEAYQKTGGKLARDDWRRGAVNRFVEHLYQQVKGAKPWVKVGISPFGIWRPGHPEGIEGFDPYGELYADAKLWLNEGWIDYFSPQLYWPIRQEKQSYPKLLAWWAAQNKRGRHLWPGNYTSRATARDRGWSAEEIVEQVKVTRRQEGATGNIHFSMKALMRNAGGVADALKAVYAEPALVPASPWLSQDRPQRPKVEWTSTGLEIQPGKDPVRLYVVRTQADGKWTVRVQPASGERVVLPYDVRPDKVLVTSVNRYGLESDPAGPVE
jgi:uncharacterized lipoprotein YddW (UPF0748 family)